ncbi:MAG: hypothetical protein CSA84_01685 [Actinomycetales bacterium]|nr:MAG: hypothetical protein CSA84_01685 [Actinomycetales bacterium]
MLRNAIRARRAAAVVLAAATIPFVGLASASASTTSHGCTVTPLQPYYHHTNAVGNKVIRYDVVVTCNTGRSISLERHVHERDNWPNPDDHISTSSDTRYFASPATVTMSQMLALPDTEIGKEEMYQQVRFRVGSGGVVSPWTAWEKSAARDFQN